MEPWLTALHAGHTDAAWNLFIDRYRRLIVATIRRVVPDDDDVMDVFSTVCQALSANDSDRLKRYSGDADRPASFATWLVAVVRNQTVDWVRREQGRARTTPPSNLSELQMRIHSAVCGGGYSHVETYELIRTSYDASLTFATFLQELRTTQRLAPCPGEARFRGAPVPLSEDFVAAEAHGPEQMDLGARLQDALSVHPSDVRTAIELFVIEGIPAADVARIVGWPNAKAVYNRVSRVLAAVRSDLEREGIRRADL